MVQFKLCNVCKKSFPSPAIPQHLTYCGVVEVVAEPVVVEVVTEPSVEVVTEPSSVEVVVEETMEEKLAKLRASLMRK